MLPGFVGLGYAGYRRARAGNATPAQIDHVPPRARPPFPTFGGLIGERESERLDHRRHRTVERQLFDDGLEADRPALAAER
jgi:hypothetical protein